MEKGVNNILSETKNPYIPRVFHFYFPSFVSFSVSAPFFLFFSFPFFGGGGKIPNSFSILGFSGPGREKEREREREGEFSRLRLKRHRVVLKSEEWKSEPDNEK